MTMTRAELLNHFTKLRARKIVLTWAQFAGAVSAADDNTKAAILTAVNIGDSKTLAPTIIGIATQKKLDLARDEVLAIAADDTLTIDELITLLS